MEATNGRFGMRRIAALMVAVMLFSFWGGLRTESAHAAGEFDAMRLKWFNMLTGGATLNTADPDVAARTAELTDKAEDLWTSMDTGAGRTYIWSDLWRMNDSAIVYPIYDRLRTLALAAKTPSNSTLYGNAALIQDILDALDWLYAHDIYSPAIDKKAQNWWHWQIGVPLSLNDICILLYAEMTANQRANYMDSVNHFRDVPNLTGANRAWTAVVVGVRAIIVEDPDKAVLARDAFNANGLFPYVTSQDGFYVDGSFIQHTTYAYTGAYGASLLEMTANLMYLFKGTTWEFTNPAHANVWQWIYDSFQPLIYKGGMMSMVRGRTISREYEEDHMTGHGVMQSIIRLSQISPEPHATQYKRMIKAWLADDTFRSFYLDASIEMIGLAKAIAGNSSITPAAPLDTYKQFAGMDRAVQHRPGYAVGLAMFSTRTKSYESINAENAGGFYTAAGAMYLYNADIGQYDDAYWPTVDRFRIPGTTVAADTANTAQQLGQSWAGGVTMVNLYGASGMDLSFSTYNLSARKSWFLFDDEIVALGAGITSTAGLPIETIVEDRKLNALGDNAFTVNGTAQPTTVSKGTDGVGTSSLCEYRWTAPDADQTLTGVSWAHLAGSAGAASDIGYYFPGGTSLKTEREERKACWKQIDNRSSTPKKIYVRNYQKMMIDHGTNPTGATYQYVVLPGKSSSQVAAYAANPAITVLANNDYVQAVKETTMNAIGANFWTDTSQSVDLITSNKKASVMTREVANETLEVSASDPTQANTGTIEIELARSADSYSADPGVTVTQLSPTIKFTVNVNAALGKTFKATFQLGEGSGDPGDPVDPELPSVIVDNADTTPGAVTKVGSWKTATTATDRYGDNYLHDNNTEKGLKSVTFTPDLPSPGYYRVSMMWPAHFQREDDVQVDVTHDGATARTSVNQQANGGTWNPIGTYYFQAGTGGSVKILNDALAAPTSYVVADAVKFEKLPDPVIVDNADTTPGAVTRIGSWTTAWTSTDRYGDNYLHDGNTDKGMKSVTFTPDLPITGKYMVYLMWPAHAQREDQVQIDIAHSGGTTRTSVNQQGSGGQWNLIGAYDFAIGTGGSVTIRNDALAAPTSYVIADAVKFVPIE